ncbi:S8 family serine peptidase [Amycolatopsis sp. GM8]|uniref:S8 family serine peptidase n=1 Tax=Amycolatopsis sp. GM8 TaxID=2896530 RepID=UPI001F005F0E|nr:S8 family serine peptidase [Amycolatopsis sp. GM8]
MPLAKPLAVLSAAVLIVALCASPASAVPKFEPVCGGALARLGCQLERLTGARDDQPVGWGARDLELSHEIPVRAPHAGTVAVVNVGAYPTLESDLAVYRARYGLPPCTSATGCFRQLDYHGGPPVAPATDPDGIGIDESIALESALDVDMASAACPDCKIVEIQLPQSVLPANGPNGTVDYHGYATAFGTAVRTAIAQGASAVSLSYGLPGDDGMMHGPIAQQLARRGVPIVAASGDEGFEATEYLWPQALPTVTSAGGTELVEQDGRYSEGAWSDAGSSCAPGVLPAAGQSALVSAACTGARTGADVSAVAADLAIYTTYSPQSHQPSGWTVVAGTSASAPFIAGVYAASGSLSGVLGPNLLYQLNPVSFQDVTSGTSGTISDGRCVPPNAPDLKQTFDVRLCAAGPGWDGPTGLGSPHGLFSFPSS